MNQTNKTAYNLEERTAKFGEAVIGLCKRMPHDTITRPLVSQLVRSATSIGANYMEANGASSRKDFAHKIFLCKKEAQETRHWLRMLLSCTAGHEEDIRKLQQECQELVLIFQKISSSTRLNDTLKIAH